jgi:hypothetical protein
MLAFNIVVTEMHINVDIKFHTTNLFRHQHQISLTLRRRGMKTVHEESLSSGILRRRTKVFVKMYRRQVERGTTSSPRAVDMAYDEREAPRIGRGNYLYASHVTPLRRAFAGSHVRETAVRGIQTSLGRRIDCSLSSRPSPPLPFLPTPINF